MKLTWSEGTGTDKGWLVAIPDGTVLKHTVFPADPAKGFGAMGVIDTGDADTGWRYRNVATTEEAMAFVQEWEDARAAEEAAL